MGFHLQKHAGKLSDKLCASHGSGLNFKFLLECILWWPRLFLRRTLKLREPARKILLFITAFQFGTFWPFVPHDVGVHDQARRNRHCLQVRGESQDTTVSIVGITLQQRRVSENIDFTTDGCHGGVCIDIRRGRCCDVRISRPLPGSHHLFATH